MSSPKGPSDLISVPSHSSDFLPNAGLRLVDTFPAIISPTAHHIASICLPRMSNALGHLALSRAVTISPPRYSAYRLMSTDIHIQDAKLQKSRNLQKLHKLQLTNLQNLSLYDVTQVSRNVSSTIPRGDLAQ